MMMINKQEQKLRSAMNRDTKRVYTAMQRLYTIGLHGIDSDDKKGRREFKTSFSIVKNTLRKRGVAIPK